jgi:RNA polymerase sigma-70 factor (ECF subfamily)
LLIVIGQYDAVSSIRQLFDQKCDSMDLDEGQNLKARILSGDVDALGEYLILQRGRLSGLLRHLIGGHLKQVIEVDDLFQEVSASAVSALPRIPKDGLDVDQWLDRLVRRRVVDAHRRYFGAEKRSEARNQVFSQMPGTDDSEAPAFEQLLIASITSPSLAVSRNWKIEKLQAAIEQLPEEQKQMIQMRYVTGCSTSEIAQHLHKTDVAVRVALSRLVAGLQAKLADQ